jgi:hypothetical protein
MPYGVPQHTSDYLRNRLQPLKVFEGDKGGAIWSFFISGTQTRRCVAGSRI